MHSFFAGTRRRNRRLQTSIYLNKQSAGMEFGVVKLGIVTAIILILLSLAINSYSPLLIRSMNIEITSYTIPINRDLVESYLVNGEWPETIEPEKYLPRTKYIKLDKVIMDKGSQDYVFHYHHAPETEYTLSFRLVPKDQAATFLWVCGYGNQDKGITLSAENNTTVPDEYLPYTCR